MSPRRDAAPSWNRGARARVALNVALVSALAVLFVVFVNYGATLWSRDHDLRLDLTRRATHTLDPTTETLVRSLSSPVEIYAAISELDPTVLSAARPDLRATRADSGLVERRYRPLLRAMLGRLASLAGEATEIQPLIRFEGVDAASNRETARRWRRELGLAEEQIVNQIVFRNAETGAWCGFSLFEVFKVDLGGPDPTQGHRPPSLKGDFIDFYLQAGLRAVTGERVARIGFAIGHDEKRLDEAGAARLLRGTNAELRTVELGTRAEIPDDLDLLVVASPTIPWEPEAKEALRGWVESGGGLLLLQGDRCAEPFSELLSPWGVELLSVQIGHPRDHVVGRGSYVLRGSSFLEPRAGERAHVITAAVEEQGRPVHLGFSRAYRETVDRDADRRLRHVLLRSGDDAAIMPLIRGSDGWRQAPERGTAIGDRAIGLALEGAAAPDGRRPRIVAVACDEWLGDAALARATNLGNRDVFLAASEWLLGRERLIAATPRLYLRDVATLDGDQFLTFRILTTAGIPLLLLLFGILVFLIRRRA